MRLLDAKCDLTSIEFHNTHDTVHHNAFCPIPPVGFAIALELFNRWGFAPADPNMSCRVLQAYYMGPYKQPLRGW
jgi:hypothetical protein